MPHTVHMSRVTAAGGEVSAVERAIDTECVVLAPTLAVKEGCSNPSVRYVNAIFIKIFTICI